MAEGGPPPGTSSGVLTRSKAAALQQQQMPSRERRVEEPEESDHEDVAMLQSAEGTDDSGNYEVMAMSYIQVRPRANDEADAQELLPYARSGARSGMRSGEGSNWFYRVLSMLYLIYSGQLLRYQRCVKKCARRTIAIALFVGAIALGAHYVWERQHQSAQWPAPPWLFWRERTGDRPFPRILLWNHFTWPGWRLHRDPLFSKEPWLTQVIQCSIGSVRSVTCEVTDNRHMLMWTDAIVFESDRVTALDLPKNRSRSQLWVLWARTHLSPENLRAVADNDLRTGSFTHEMGPLFNWTMGNREDADIVVPYMHWRCGQSQSFAAQSQKQEHRERRDLGWIVGECEHRSYADMLALRPSNVTSVLGGLDIGSVRVHMLRGCGRTHCGNRTECVAYIAERFKFIVVSLTPDCFHSAYEVIFEAFKYNLVPIVLAPPKTILKIPDGSVVSSAHLQGPGQLAAHVNALLKNPNKYHAYFLWKRRCSLIPIKISLCSLCGALWKKPLRKQMHPNARDWWIKPAKCTERNKPLYGLDWAFNLAKR
ncbi:hypothetical protein V5799_017090 [Amblyomma americanum]|uniref:Fucosyltransferase n=1 Tax=Amblyomma americanum TaxID=6943 RepID=A0AAQ4F3D7_AMBAM